VAGILLSTSLLKGRALIAPEIPFSTHDRLTGLPAWFLLGATAVTELAVSGIVLWGRGRQNKLATIAVMGFTFLCYHAGTEILAGGSGCNCFGILSHWVPAFEPFQRPLAISISMFMMLGSFLFIYRIDREVQSSGASRSCLEIKEREPAGLDGV
jgi:hypothetical protein